MVKKNNFSVSKIILIASSSQPTGNKQIDYFSLLFTEELIELIVQETNVYAVEVFKAKSGSLTSRISQWKNRTVQEMKIF